MGHWEQIGEANLEAAKGKPSRDWLGLIAVPFAVLYWFVVIAAFWKIVRQIYGLFV